MVDTVFKQILKKENKKFKTMKKGDIKFVLANNCILNIRYIVRAIKTSVRVSKNPNFI